MCDGQNRFMQHYLRVQSDKVHNINLVSEVAHFLEHIWNIFSTETMELVHLTLQTLIEMCVGNYPNQADIFSCRVVDVINEILQRQESPSGKGNEEEKVSDIHHV